jgi:hypothetical protein
MLLVNDNPIIEGFHLKDCMEKVHRDLMATGSNTRDGIEISSARWPHILPQYALAKRSRYRRHIETLSQRMMTTYRLRIAIKHALPNWRPMEEEVVEKWDVDNTHLKLE